MYMKSLRKLYKGLKIEYITPKVIKLLKSLQRNVYSTKKKGERKSKVNRIFRINNVEASTSILTVNESRVVQILRLKF